jgi:hypothetical protein
VEAVAAGPGRVDGGQVQQLGVGQPLHQLLGLVMTDPEQGAGQPGREVSHLQQAQPPQRPLLVQAERLVAQGQAGPDLQIPGGQLIQPPPRIRQQPGQPGQRPTGPGGQPGPRHPDGQRQPTAEAHDLGG